MSEKKVTQQSIIYSQLRDRLKKQGYQLFGKQIAIKKCLWTHKYLKDNKFCYKNIYGIQSHRCIQATPTLLCNHQCLFCWRLQEKDVGMKPILNATESDFDTPEEVYESLFLGWKKCIYGYKPFISKEKYNEALHPKHVALSLAGEPTLYPFLIELLSLLRNKGLTSFLVTNGTNPKTIEKMIEENIFPNQLYITLPAPNKEKYLQICKPLINDGWERINASLDLMAKIESRTVLRLTVAKKINMINPQEYAKLISKVNPSFVEIKGFVPVGFSQYRVTRENMPYIEDIKIFSKKIFENLTNYRQVAEIEDSKVAIFSNEKHKLKMDEL